ncbi:MAG: hypothetical protein ABSF61_01235 [Anaerolineales bacterium]
MPRERARRLAFGWQWLTQNQGKPCAVFIRRRGIIIGITQNRVAASIWCIYLKTQAGPGMKEV